MPTIPHPVASFIVVPFQKAVSPQSGRKEALHPNPARQAPRAHACNLESHLFHFERDQALRTATTSPTGSTYVGVADRFSIGDTDRFRVGDADRFRVDDRDEFAGDVRYPERLAYN